LWALGVAVSLVLLLVGASFFANFKVHEKDIQRLSDDYSNKLKVFRSDMDAELSKVSREIADAYDSRSQQDLDRMLDQTSQVRSQFEALRELVTAKHDEMQKALVKTDLAVERSSSALHRHVSEFRRIETKIWALGKVPSNVVLAATQGLRGAIAVKSEWEIDDFAQRIRDSLSEFFVENDNMLSQYTLESVKKILVNLREVRPVIAEEIAVLLEACKNSVIDVDAEGSKD
jgi:hypothetical protein